MWNEKPEKIIRYFENTKHIWKRTEYLTTKNVI